MDEKSASELFIRMSMGKQFRRNVYQGNGYKRNGYPGNGYQKLFATIGGTFDTLHAGHKEYIQLAFTYADHVLVYVSSDDYAYRNKNYRARSYEFRVQQLMNFIRELGCEKRYEIRCLHNLEQLKTDYLETDGLNGKICIAIVSPEYYEFFLRINQAREALGMKTFLILVKLRKLDREKRDISSSVIRSNSIEKHIPQIETSL